MVSSLPVSVVIPCFRCESTIARAVSSVVTQTYLPTELILVDDFSNDDGKTLAELYRLQNSCDNLEIKVIALTENVGPGEARNAGWNHITQPYLAFLDADDSWHPEKLRIQYNWMLANPQCYISGHTSLIFSKDTPRFHTSDYLKYRIVKKSSLIFFNKFSTRTVMLKSDVSYRFSEKKRYAEDYLLWLTIVLNNYSAVILDIPLAYTYKNEFGDGGLTRYLWRMEKGVQETYWTIYSNKLIPFLVLVAASFFSILKFIRRVILVQVRSRKDDNN
jgi:glycosyltransferase involved in cell wall biosynthesis